MKKEKKIAPFFAPARKREGVEEEDREKSFFTHLPFFCSCSYLNCLFFLLSRGRASSSLERATGAGGPSPSPLTDAALLLLLSSPVGCLVGGGKVPENERAEKCGR